MANYTNDGYQLQLIPGGAPSIIIQGALYFDSLLNALVVSNDGVTFSLLDNSLNWCNQICSLSANASRATDLPNNYLKGVGVINQTTSTGLPDTKTFCIPIDLCNGGSIDTNIWTVTGTGSYTPAESGGSIHYLSTDVDVTPVMEIGITDGSTFVVCNTISTGSANYSRLVFNKSGQTVKFYKELSDTVATSTQDISALPNWYPYVRYTSVANSAQIIANGVNAIDYKTFSGNSEAILAGTFAIVPSTQASFEIYEYGYLSGVAGSSYFIFETTLTNSSAKCFFKAGGTLTANQSSSVTFNGTNYSTVLISKNVVGVNVNTAGTAFKVKTFGSYPTTINANGQNIGRIDPNYITNSQFIFL